MTARYRFQLRRGTSAEWADEDPVLLAGEPGVDTETHELRVGDGVHRWSELTSIGAGGGVTVSDVQAWIAAAIDGLPPDEDGAPDVPGTVVDVTSSWKNILTDSSMSWGFGATSTLRWSRVGRLIFAEVVVHATVDHDTGLPFLPITALPAEPEASNPNTASGFAYAGIPTEMFGTDGGLIPLGPVVTASTPGGLIFVQMSGLPGDGGLRNVWATDGQISLGADPPYTLDTTGKAFDLYAGFVYEAAEAAT